MHLQVSAAITARAYQLPRLRGVLRVVGATSLFELQQAWASGELLAAGLAAEDVQLLLMSTTEDSPGRRSLLAALHAGAGPGGSV